MRYDTEHKQRTRKLILREAAEAIRQNGPDKLGVASLMAKAGLTHGGFYAHFKSRDALVAEAVAAMFETQQNLLQEKTHGRPPDQGLIAYLDSYLSTAHRDQRGQGCPVAALSSDSARMDKDARKRFNKGLENMVSGLAQLIDALPRPGARALAVSMVAEMVGAMGMARSVTDAEFSAQILNTAKESILGRLGLG